MVEHTMKFELTAEQVSKFEAWKDTLPKPPRTAIGGAFQFLFSPTSIATGVKVIAWNGERLDLSDYETW